MLSPLPAPTATRPSAGEFSFLSVCFGFQARKLLSLLCCSNCYGYELGAVPIASYSFLTPSSFLANTHRRDQGGSSATSVDHTQDAQKRSCSRPTAESQQQQQPSDAQQQQQQQPQQQKQQPQQPQQQGEQQEEFAVPRGVLPRRAALGASSLGRASLPHLGRSSNHPLHRCVFVRVSVCCVLINCLICVADLTPLR